MQFMKKELFSDVAFVMIGQFDSIQRLENACITSDYICNQLGGKVYFLEVGRINNGIFEQIMNSKIVYEFIQDYNPVFHRTKYINYMVNKVHEKIVSIWDVDVCVSQQQIIKTLSAIREREADFVYPYDKLFLDVTYEIRDIFLESRDVSILQKFQDFMPCLYTPNPVGGVFFARRKTYIESGGENELFYGWGIEDGERYNRWLMQGYKIKKISGPVFHFPHPRGINSMMESKEADIIKTRIFLSSIKKQIHEKRNHKKVSSDNRVP